MNDTIVQEVRDARAALAERFGYDRSRIIAWAREETKARKASVKMNQGESGGAEQPATRPESKSEGSQKAQPKAEGRSR